MVPWISNTDYEPQNSLIDPFVLAAPFLLLGVISLLGFVGCFTKPPPPDAGRAFIREQTLGSNRTDKAFFGMTFKVGSDPLTVRTLGRFFHPGNTGIHRMRLIDADDATNPQRAEVTVSMVGGEEGKYKYEPVSPVVRLDADHRYYLLSEELNPGDEFYDQDTIVRYTEPGMNPAATVESAVYSDNPGVFVPVGGADHCFGPVNFEYVIDF
jgi:hypothetical protein